MIVLRELAYAKINLYLHITGKRPDNYHLLDSLVAFCDVGDKVEAVPSETVTVALDGPFAGAVDKTDNTVLKAAEMLKKQFNVTTGAALTLVKNLPVGGGIGGGSADAAAALKLLSRFWKIKPSAQELHKIGLSIGADVPACLRGGSLYMSGIGEILEVGPPLPGYAMVLVNPGKPLATRDVFAAHKAAHSSAPRHPHAFASKEALVQFLVKTKNDLQAASLKLLPDIETVLDAIMTEKDCLLARMSGSGSTCFGLFADLQAAQTAATQISARHPDWWVKAAAVR